MKEKLLQLKILLAGSEPSIWRRIQVNGDITFHELHGIIQVAMGWQNCHFYAFEINNRHIITTDINTFSHEENEAIYANEVCLHDMINRKKQEFKYIYDFNCDWVHNIQFEEYVGIEKGKRFPLCIDGENACPPENTGSIYNFNSYLDELSDNSPNGDSVMYDQEIKDRMRDYNPKEFSTESINKNLRKLEW